MTISDRSSLLNGCRWVASLGSDGDTQNIVERIGFEALRFFWLTSIAPGQWRGRHAHRESILATFAVRGACRITLDNGKRKQVVDLRDDGSGLIVGPWIWHDLYDFTADAAILVAASTPYTEADYIRDYTYFLREAAARGK